MSPNLFLVHSTKQRFLSFFLLLLCFTIPSANSNAVSGQLEPMLLALATTAPDSTVAVIVQLQPNAGTITEALTRIGGKQTKDLHIINALVAELPAGQLPALAAVAGVRWISLDAPVVETACDECIPTKPLRTVYNQAINANKVWNNPPYLQGKGIGVAVVDSGINARHPALAGHVVARNNTLLPMANAYDGYGHGTFVAGLISGDDHADKRRYVGVAPKSNLIDVHVTSLTGASTESDVVEGLQWIYENHKAYNIRVVNISLNASIAQSYHTSPLDAACEILWFNGIVVVTSAGNAGEGKIYPPANDPFVITVGATDDKGTATIDDDSVAHFSAYGTTVDGFAKPDLVAPGRYIVAPMADSKALLPLLRSEMVVNGSYMRMSGTSFAAPIVSGAIALLLENEPHLTPDQVKYRLMKSANRQWPSYDKVKAGAGYLNIAAAIKRDTTESANTGVPMSRLLTTGNTRDGQIVGSLFSLNWDSVSWSTVSWSTVSWSTVSWSTVSWSSDYIERDDDDDNEDELELPGIFGLLLREGDNTLLTDEENSLQESSDTSDENREQMLSNHIYLPIVVGNE